jgi:hypothetical protein
MILSELEELGVAAAASQQDDGRTLMAMLQTARGPSWAARPRPLEGAFAIIRAAY